MDSSPESGPIMTSAPSCSMSRRVSLIAVSARSSEQPTPTILIGWSPMAPPVMPSRGLFGFFGLAPANCENAATTPARSWLSNDPNAPWQSDRTPTLIGVPEPPLRGATAACGGGKSAAVAAVCFVFDPELLLDDELLLLLSLLLEPQPATTNAANATSTARTRGPRFPPPPASISLPFPPPPSEAAALVLQPGWDDLPPTTCLPRPASLTLRVSARPAPFRAGCRPDATSGPWRSASPTGRSGRSGTPGRSRGRSRR